MLAIKSVIILLWFFLALISLNHLYPFWDVLVFSISFLGVLGWITIFITLIFLSRRFIKQALLIFLLFFSLGYFLGPYLEPPADPLRHLHWTYLSCDKSSDNISKRNKGLWHFSMSSNFLCFSNRSIRPETVLTRIDILHGVYWGLLMVGLFILSKSAGLPNRWAFMSIIIAFLFFGTNRFSYFSYYSMAPSFSSILMYWLWTATFFFKKSWKDILLGLLMAVISIPILYTNHIQEVAFVLFIASIWLIWNISERIWALLSEKNKTIEILESNNSRDLLTKNDIWYRQPRVRTWMKQNYILILFVVLFILPQFESFQNLISQLSFQNAWQHNQELVIFWKGFHVMGKMWSYRVNDTLGIMSTIPILLCIPFFWPGVIRIHRKNKFRILLLGSTPFAICFIPAFHFIWVSNASISVYYRLCYSSIFWITIAYFLYGLEGRFLIYWKKIRSTGFSRIFKATERISFKAKYFTVSLVIIIMIGSIRSGPVYGKLDFILLETRPWWSEWKPMIKNSMKQDRKVIYSDKLTSMVLRDIFNLPIANKYSGRFHGSVLDVQSMDTGKMSPKYRYIINLHGFNPSWVPKETGHWSPKLANTSLYYRDNRLRGEELKRFLKENPPENCEIYF